MISSKAERATLVTSSTGSGQHRKYYGKYKTWFRWFVSDSWALEYLAMMIAIAALATIFITLLLYGGKPLGSWPYSIQLNTVLSTLATIMKGFMLMPVCACLSQLKWLWYTHKTKSLQDFQIFDMASRGPWGVIQLLFRLKFWHMASVGGLVTLLSLASDAFVQQSVSYPPQLSAQSNSTATIPYTQRFEMFSNSPGNPFVRQLLITAVYNGVHPPNLTRQPYCPTGHCTFPDYASLAVCSNCHNVTSLLQITNMSGEFDVRKYSLPNGHTMVEDYVTGDTPFLNISASFAYPLPGNTTLPLNGDALSRYQTGATITNISVITGGSVSRPGNLNAWDCVLSFCVKSYHGHQSLSYSEDTALDIFDELKLSVFHASRTGGSANIIIDVPWTHLTTIGNQNRTFSVPNVDLMKLQKSLAAILFGEFTVLPGGTNYVTGIAQGFYYNGLENVEKTLASIADALTDTIRMNSKGRIQGTVLIVEPFIQIQLFWLLYPLVMVILATVFLGLTVRRTQQSGVPSWRSSVLAVMEHGVNSSIQEDTGSDLLNGFDSDLATTAGKERVGDLEVWAEDVSVRLRRRGLWGRGFGLTVT